MSSTDRILGNPGLQRGSEGKGETGSGKKGEGRGGERKGERGKGKPWEASLYKSFLDRRANTISEVWNRSARMTKETGEVQLAPSKLHSKICLLTRRYLVNRFRWLLSASITDQIDHFIVVYSVTWPLNGSEAGGDLVLIQTSLLLFCKSSCSDAY